MLLIAIDPGMNSPGTAVFSDGVLLRADRVQIPAEFASKPPGQRWTDVAHRISSFAGKYLGGPQMRLDIVFECPQWYQRTKSKGDPNDLVGVAGVAAAFAGIMSCRYVVDVRSPTPAEWIGQVPKVCPVCKGKKSRPATLTEQMMNNRKRKPKRVKAVCAECGGSAWGTPRGRRIQSRLSAYELALVPDQNDAIDAVGIGLWALGRLEKISVFSNGKDGR